MYRKILSAEFVAPEDMGADAADLCRRMLAREPTERLGYRGADEVRPALTRACVGWVCLCHGFLYSTLSMCVRACVCVVLLVRACRAMLPRLCVHLCAFVPKKWTVSSCSLFHYRCVPPPSGEGAPLLPRH